MASTRMTTARLLKVIAGGSLAWAAASQIKIFSDVERGKIRKVSDKSFKLEHFADTTEGYSMIDAIEDSAAPKRIGLNNDEALVKKAHDFHDTDIIVTVPYTQYLASNPLTGRPSRIAADIQVAENQSCCGSGLKNKNC